MNGETSDEDSCGGASENTSLMSTQVEPGTTDPDVGSSLQTTDQVIESNQIFQIVKKTCIQSVGPLKALYTSPPGKPVHSGTNSTSLGNILLAMQQKQRLFTHISTTVYN